MPLYKIFPHPCVGNSIRFKSFSCFWNLTNIANDSDLNLCRIAQPFTSEDARSVLLHTAEWYSRPPYTTKVHGAEKMTSLKNQILKFPVFNESQKSITIFKNPVPDPSPARLVQYRPKRTISLRSNFIFLPFTSSSSSKNAYIYHKFTFKQFYSTSPSSFNQLHS